MTLVYEILIVVSLCFGIIFVGVLGAPWRSENPPMTWLQAALAWVAITLDAILLIMLLGHRIPEWLGITWLLAQDAVFGWRLTALIKLRKEVTEDVPKQP